MRYRALDDNGDATFGSGSSAFFVDEPDAVRQAIQTRLWLMQGEWFLDLSEGTPYTTEIMGRTEQTYDFAVKTRILGTRGVKQLVSYSSSLNRANRMVNVNCTVETIYGAAVTLSTQIAGPGLTTS
jgi:hypothetical protein